MHGLTAAKARLDICDSIGLSALHQACDKAHVECVRTLAEAGAPIDRSIEDVDEYGSALTCAAGHPKSDKLLPLLLAQLNADWARSQVTGPADRIYGVMRQYMRARQRGRTHTHTCRVTGPLTS